MKQTRRGFTFKVHNAADVQLGSYHLGGFSATCDN